MFKNTAASSFLTNYSEVWEPAQAVALFDESQRPPLCREVSPPDQAKLVRWAFVDQIDKAKVLDVLQRVHPPKPATWRKLITLWAYLASELTGYRHSENAQILHIVPVQGGDALYAASEVVRLGEKKLLVSDEDWAFLAQYLTVLNPNWSRFLAEQKRGAAERDNSGGGDDVEAAYAILKKIGLEDASDVSKVVGQVGSKFFSQTGITLENCVRLAQIAAKMEASVALTFRFVSRDMKIRTHSIRNTSSIGPSF